MTSIALTHRDEILERLRSGEYMKDIAISLGVTKQAISQVLHDDPEYMQAREDGMAERLDKAHALLAEITQNEEIKREDAKEWLDLARIREVGLKRLEWRAEREFPRRWAAKTEHKQDMAISITVNRGLPGNIIEVSTDELRKVEDKSLK